MKKIWIARLIFIASVVFYSLPAWAAQESSILFIFDASGSMREKIEGKSKLSIAKETLSALAVDLASGVKSGLMVYGHGREKNRCQDIELIVPLKEENGKTIQARLKPLKAIGKTPIAASLKKAAEAIKKIPGKKRIVLISDGEETCGGDPIKTAQKIKEELGIDIVIDVVGFDVKGKGQKQLAAIAQAAGGSYYSANNARQLKDSLGEIKQEVVKEEPKKEPPKVPEPPKDIFVENFDEPFLSEDWDIINDSPDGRTLEGGKFVVVTTPGWLSDEAVKNILLYNKEIPAKDYEVTVEFSTSTAGAGYPGYAAQYSGIILYADKDNHLGIASAKCNKCGDWNRKAVEFYKRQGGESPPSFYWDIPAEGNPYSYKLKIEKRGYKYRGFYFDPDEGKWQKLGTFTMLGKKLRPGIAAYRYHKAEEVVTEFDSFKIRELK